MQIMNSYWLFFNFMVRRVVASGFVVIGLIIALSNFKAILPDGTIMMNGSPTDDIVLRAVSVFMPLVISVLGIALYRVEPFKPNE